MMLYDWYNWCLLVGGGITLFATSNGIWAYMVPGKRNSPVPLTFAPRLASLVAGVLVTLTGLVGLLLATF